jgi:NAD(P)-dependent dehydrogenase (short-subunit alcohol dehydrogenase family)
MSPDAQREGGRGCSPPGVVPHCNGSDCVNSAVIVPQEPSRGLRVVITGGSVGIGRAMVEAFARAGHCVLFTYLHSDESAEQLTKNIPNASKALLDQGDFESVLAFASAAAAWAGDEGIDVLVNNAALGSATVKRYVDRVGLSQSCRSGSTINGCTTANANGNLNRNITSNIKLKCHCKDHISKNHIGKNHISKNRDGSKEAPRTALDRLVRQAAEDEALLRVNALGPLWVTEALMPLLQEATRAHNARRSHATVIFIGSVGGGSSAVFPEYRPSDLMGKAAVTYLSKHLAAEHVQDDIDVMCVSPGATETDMFRESTLSKHKNVGQFIDGMPKRCLIQPCDIAETVRWLATSSAARVLHGSVLDASMGLAVRPGLQTEYR